MPNAVDALREIASINLRYALADIEMEGEGDAFARALVHVREVEACLQILILEAGGIETEPLTGLAEEIEVEQDAEDAA